MSSHTQDTGLNRKSVDKFYTKENIVKFCLEKIDEYLKINNDDLIIECSAGNGSFTKILENKYKNVISYDILPEYKNIIKQDYLGVDINLFKNYKQIHVISNPPFGRQSSLVKKFIKKSCLYCNTISFILPKSFKKDSNKKSFDLYYHLLKEYDLPENSFLINNKEEYNVPCIFQIWIKKDIKREEIKEEEPKYFSFKKKKENPDLSFRRVGVNAGKMEKEIKLKSEESHYFIKLNSNIIIDDFLSKYNTITFESDNTVGPKSISKQELIKKINTLFD